MTNRFRNSSRLQNERKRFKMAANLRWLPIGSHLELETIFNYFQSFWSFALFLNRFVIWTNSYTDFQKNNIKTTVPIEFSIW